MCDIDPLVSNGLLSLAWLVALIFTLLIYHYLDKRLKKYQGNAIVQAGVVWGTAILFITIMALVLISPVADRFICTFT